MPLGDAGKRNPLARQRAHVLGLALAPVANPDQIPLLALRQVDDEGLVCGEVWLRPADLPGLIAALTEQLLLNYSAGTRRWRGMPDGPLLNLG